MSAFLVFRTLFFALFILVNVAILTVAALNLNDTIPNELLRHVDAYLIFYSAASLLFVLPIILVDFLRRGALTSTVWFECVWLFVSWLMNLCGAAAVTALTSVPTCGFAHAASCSTGEVLVGVTWTATLLVLAQLVLMVVAPTIYSKRYPNVWIASVRDFQWFNGGGSGKSEVLQSQPPSPTMVPRQISHRVSNPVPRLEQLATQWQPAPVTQVQAPIMTVVPSKPIQTTKASEEPQPLTYAYAPAIPPSRVPMHYSATAGVSVGVLPERRPSKKISTAGPSLYPQSVQTAVSSSPASRVHTTSALPTTTPPQSLPRRATTSSSAVAEEPLPIKGWPRVNPQEPYRKDRSAATQAVSRPAAVQPLGPGGPAYSASPLTERRTRGPRPRPPPLNLVATSPARIR